MIICPILDPVSILNDIIAYTNLQILLLVFIVLLQCLLFMRRRLHSPLNAGCLSLLSIALVFTQLIVELVTAFYFRVFESLQQMGDPQQMHCDDFGQR
jgi:hypothetical protein